MENQRKRIEETQLAELKNIIETQFKDVAETEDKLKLLLVLTWLVEEAIKIMDNIDKSSFLTELTKKVENLQKSVDQYKQQLVIQAKQDRVVLEALESDDNNLKNLGNQIGELLKEFESQLKKIAELRDKLSIAERNH